MQYKLIKGKFFVKGYSPDGDSIRFVADDKNLQKWFQWKQAGNINKAKANKEIKMQLRLQAIDALETHYNTKYHQPRSFAIAAMDALLNLLGISVYHYSIDYSKITEAEDGKAGAIITSGLDMYDRPISFVYSGSLKQKDGAEIKDSTVALFKKSINYNLLSRGIVYPTFYDGFEGPLLNLFRKASKDARKKGKGIWSIERTSGFTFWETWTIQDDVIILPKLFRRLSTFIDNYTLYDELESYFKKTKDPVRLLNTNEKKDFSDLLDIENRNIGLRGNPEDLIFIPK